MSPLRILIIVILVYIGYRLVVSGKKKKVAPTKDHSNKPPREMPASDILVEDPICKKLVPKQQATTFEEAGTIHYFCGKECCRIFRNQHGEQQ